MRAGIVGLGLMGGSLGLALKKSGKFDYIYGLDHNPMHKDLAIALGLVDECTNKEEILKCDIIFLAIPVEAIISFIDSVDSLPTHTTIVDLGSTKDLIHNSIPKKLRKNFITAHPMCGTENFGPKAAIDNLYRDKIVVLTDLASSGELQVALAKDIFVSIGMHIVNMESKEHDNHAAYISHLPHIISYALANTVLAQEDPQSILLLAAGGFKDMSRIAKSSPKMWCDISKQNREFLLQSIYKFEEELKNSKKMIENREWDDLLNWMESAVKLHDIL